MVNILVIAEGSRWSRTFELNLSPSGISTPNSQSIVKNVKHYTQSTTPSGFLTKKLANETIVIGHHEIGERLWQGKAPSGTYPAPLQAPCSAVLTPRCYGAHGRMSLIRSRGDEYQNIVAGDNSSSEAIHYKYSGH